jgi:phosphoserine phosphatase
MIRAGVPEQIAEMNAQAFSLTADGDAEWVTQDVQSLLGRPARSLEQFAADYAAAFS